MSFSAVGDYFAGTVSGGGTLGLNAGYDRLSKVTWSVADVSIGATTTVSMSGAIDITGAVTSSAHVVRIEATGVTLTGGGVVTLTGPASSTGSAACRLSPTRTPSAAAPTRRRQPDHRQRRGDRGDSATTMDVAGYGTLVNSGLIEAVGAGHDLTILGPVRNTGTLESDVGTLTVSGAVTGAGTIRLEGGRVAIDGATAEAVVFVSTGPPGAERQRGIHRPCERFLPHRRHQLRPQGHRLQRGQGQLQRNRHSLHPDRDQRGPKRSPPPHRRLPDRRWTLSNDGSGGTVVVDPTPASPAAQALRIATAAAGFGADGGTGDRLFAGPHDHPPLLAGPSSRLHFA